ncbi:hypothetical protein IMZ48_13240, partial [Candidatus Bathyarchaeota archaeon]|nr:hypothetical protein [Candidatus Bathyarchaeota archaeon]
MGTLDDGLRYSWVDYLPVNISQSGFFESLRLRLLDKLRGARVVESRSGR